MIDVLHERTAEQRRHGVAQRFARGSPRRGGG
jgi:hypothetical protein